MSKRTLRLVKETLTPLDTDSLGSVVGGWVSIPQQQCMPLTFKIECLNDISLEICPTLPVEDCI